MVTSMVTEAEYSAQESERAYGRLELTVMAERLDNANKAIKVLGDTLRELRNVVDNRDQHSDDYLEDLDDRVDTILHELEELKNGY